MNHAEFYVTKTLYEKNATDGLKLHRSREALAEDVVDHEASGGKVQVYLCVPVGHHAYTTGAHIQFEGGEGL